MPAGSFTRGFAQIVREAPATIARQFYDQRLSTTLIYAFAVGGIIACAPLIIGIIYDPRYQPAIPYFQILLISSFFVMSNYATNEVMIALGHPKFTMNANIVRLAFLAASGLVGLRPVRRLGLVWVVGVIEAAAQLYGWICLYRLRLLDPGKEMLVLGVGAAGFALGFGVDAVGLALLHWLKVGTDSGLRVC